MILQSHFYKVAQTVLAGGVAYILFYISEEKHFGGKFIARIFIILLSSYMIMIVFIICIGNITKLLFMGRLFRLQNIEVPSKEIMQKVIIYFIFGFITSLYYIYMIIEQIYILAVHLTALRLNWIDGIECNIIFIYHCFIFILFHPCFFTVRFRMVQIYPHGVNH